METTVNVIPDDTHTSLPDTARQVAESWRDGHTYEASWDATLDAWVLDCTDAACGAVMWDGGRWISLD